VDVSDNDDTEVYSASIFRIEVCNNLRKKLTSVSNQREACNSTPFYVPNNKNFGLKYCIPAPCCFRYTHIYSYL
jgi:hypothetical protein